MNELKEAVKEVSKFYGEDFYSKDAGKVTKATKTLLDFATLAIKAEESGFPAKEKTGLELGDYWDEATDNYNCGANQMRQLCLNWHTAWLEKKLEKEKLVSHIEVFYYKCCAKEPSNIPFNSYSVARAIQDYFGEGK